MIRMGVITNHDTYWFQYFSNVSVSESIRIIDKVPSASSVSKMVNPFNFFHL